MYKDLEIINLAIELLFIRKCEVVNNPHCVSGNKCMLQD